MEAQKKTEVVYHLELTPAELDTLMYAVGAYSSANLFQHIKSLYDQLKKVRES